jgi:hypothetical protein
MFSLNLRGSQGAKSLVVLGGLLIVACGVPDYKLTVNAGDGGNGGNPTGGAGAQYGGNSAAGGSSAILGCSSNSDCSNYSATTVCDSSVSPGRCVECLPGKTDCGTGLYCGSDKHCQVGCSSNADCGTADCDASVCASLTCDTSTHLCIGCSRDSDCLAGTTCSAATQTCVPRCSESNTCPSDWVCCAGRCANLETDATNCASCGTTCAQVNANVQCLNGTCRVESCVEGYADCNSKFSDGCEVDLLSDATNCKTCNSACVSPLVCRNGACATSSCTATYLDCDGVPGNGCEADTQRDSSNCGSCGNKCSSANGTPSCVSGSCVMTCNSGWGDCNGNANDGCETNLTATTDHCGTCSVACLNNHGSTSCVASKCVPGCGSGFGDCNGNPIDGCEAALTTEANNCGACGSVCALAHVASSTCNGGKCTVVNCEANYGDCNGAADDGCEASLAALTTNCGKCGNVCSSTNGASRCSGGSCAIDCGANYGNCDTDLSNGCETDLAKSVKNCGACGTVCADTNDYTATCSNGTCGVSSCIKPAAECDGNAGTPCETNLNTDAKNCGACGNVCSIANASATCSGGVCVMGPCNSGYANCNGDARDGCEVNTSTDVANCGKCGAPCSLGHATASCTSGTCTVASCESGYQNCNGIATDGCESHVPDDATNCGACGNACSLSHAVAGCASGTCIVSSCSPGYENCNGADSDGCEVNLTADPVHCGACSTVCNANNGIATCSAGLCGIVCNGNHDNCDGDVAANGCETDLTSTTLHCGSCTTACTNGNGTTNCVSGVCAPICNAGYLSCDNNLVNGCEQNVFTDTSHCGGCATACGAYVHANAQCASGVCNMGDCASGYADCNASAGCETPITSDPNNCGGCNGVCPGANGVASCTNSACSIACNSGYGDCVAGADGCETNTATSATHCGACTIACSGSYPTCAAGKCLLDIVAQKTNAAKGTGAGTSPPTIAHTLSLASSNQRLVIVTVVGRGSTSTEAVPVPKYAGTTMSLFGSVSPSANDAVAIYYLLDSALPASAGTYNVTFTAYSQNYAIIATVLEFDNVDQTTPFPASKSQTFSSPSATSVSVTPPLAGDYSIEVVGASAGSSPTATANSGQTVVGAGIDLNNSFGITAIRGPYASAGSQALSWTLAGCNSSGQIAIVIGRASS